MGYTTISDPGIAQGFSILANALTPNVDGVIKADYMRGQRNKVDAETQKLMQEMALKRAAEQRVSDLQGILAGGNYEDPTYRAQVMSRLAGVEGGLQYGPEFATGAMTFTKPNALPESDLSNVLVGTGVVNGYGDTPTGQGRALQNDLIKEQMQGETDRDVQRISNVGAMDRQTSVNETTRATRTMEDEATMARLIAELASQKENLQFTEANDLKDRTMQSEADLAAERIKGDYVLQQEKLKAARTATPQPKMQVVTPDTQAKLMEELTAEIARQYGSDMALDPAVQSALAAEVARAYQYTGNAGTAIADVLAANPIEVDDGWFSDSIALANGAVRPAASVPATPTVRPIPDAAPAPAQTIRNPNTGEVRELRNGQWVTIVPPKGQ